MGTCSSSFLPVGSSRVPCMAQSGHWRGVWGVEWTLSLAWLKVVTGEVCGTWSGHCPLPCCAVLIHDSAEVLCWVHVTGLQSTRTSRQCWKQHVTSIQSTGSSGQCRKHSSYFVLLVHLLPFCLSCHAQKRVKNDAR